MKKAMSIRVISIAAFFVICSSQLFAWGSKVHMKIVSDAYHIMPKAFRKTLGEVDKPKLKKPAMSHLLYGSVQPDKEFKDFHNHVFHIHGYNMGKGPFHIETLVDEVVEDIKSKKSLKTIAAKLGWIAHYASDLVQPLHTGVSTEETVEEKSYHSATERDADKHMDYYGVKFDGCTSIKRVSARMIYEALWANQYYEDLQNAYVHGKRYEDSKKIISECYSRAVNNVVDLWYTVYLRAGGQKHPSHFKAKNYPPLKRVISE
jgi:hypothetical protein